MERHDIAIIMSLYGKDNESYLNECLDSILQQTYTSWHLFLYSDGTIPSELQNIVDNFITQYKSKITFCSREKNMGLAMTLNDLIAVVLEKSSAKYVVRMDSDDIAVADRFSLQYSYMEQHPEIDVSGGGCYEFGSDFSKNYKKVLSSHEELSDKIFNRCPFVHPTVIFKRSVFESGMRYPTDTFMTEDLAFWFLLLSKGFRFGNIDTGLIYYRQSNNTVLRRRGFDKALSELKLRVKYQFRFRRLGLQDSFYTLSHFILRLFPASLFGYLYKRFR
ncbi:glycosyltransferase [Budviciaceae bacterium BWR-B9]|uniref:Glycosyltransferase n=1 Tax=Limnobaculum allomyrinae TaxID=2791986 RepID=A0ABS1IVB1_9GAMM|nr:MULTISPECIES: glycosyltransferase [Limnobaculum]MBK5145709.1 glycosyltransferase [Limnobaculum allomyrinae]MBV7693757.1 glycosyltransferase [Limnobaculum sp. M2-1]